MRRRTFLVSFLIFGTAATAGCTASEESSGDEDPGSTDDEDQDDTDDQADQEPQASKEVLINFEVTDDPPEDADLITGDDPLLDELDALEQVYENLAREADIIVESEDALAEFEGTFSAGRNIDPESSEWEAARRHFPVYLKYEGVVLHGTYRIVRNE